MAELDLLLGIPTLGKMTEQYMSLKKNGPFARKFQLVRETCDGETYVWDKIRNDRRLAAARAIDGDAFVEQAPNHGVKRTGFLHLAVKERLSPKKLFLTAAPGRLMARSAEEHIARAVARNVSRIYRAQEYVSARLMQDTAGVAFTSSNTAFPTGAVSINETMTIDGGLLQDTVGARWNIDTTEIIGGDSQLMASIQNLADRGFPAGQIIINRALAKEIARNLEAQTWFAQSMGWGVDFYKKLLAAFSGADSEGRPSGYQEDAGSALNGLGDIEKWHVWDDVYEDGNGTQQRYMDATKAVILPPDEVIRESESMVWVDGPVIRPDGPGVIGDAQSAAQAFAVERGVVSYGWREPSDLGALWVVTRASFLPLVKNEFAIRSMTGL